MAIYNKLTETKFKAIKILLESGATVSEVEKYMDISNQVIYQVRKCETYEEYVNFRAARDLESKRIAAIKAKEKEEAEKRKAEQKQEPEEPKPETVKSVSPTVIKVEANHYMMQEMQKTNELLTLISKKLAFIVDELTGVKS